jgi:hypothetical protein
MADDTIYAPPKRISYIDNLIVVDPTTGKPMEFWKSLLLTGSILRERMEARADSAAEARREEAPPAEKRPPPVVADKSEEGETQVREAEQLRRILADHAKIDATMDRIKRRTAAVRAIRRAESALERAESNPSKALAECDQVKPRGFATLDDLEGLPPPHRLN